jgi:hypothetical protein
LFYIQIETVFSWAFDDQFMPKSGCSLQLPFVPDLGQFAFGVIEIENDGLEIGKLVDKPPDRACRLREIAGDEKYGKKNYAPVLHNGK